MKTFFSLPFLLIYLLVIVFICWRRGYKRVGQSLICIIILGIYLLCTPLMTKVLLKMIGEFPPFTHPERLREQGYQAIVVLGGGLYRGEEMHNDWQAGGYSLARLRYAAYLARVSQLPVLITGIEAPALASTFIQDFGVQAAWQEVKSINTDENARFSADLLRSKGILRVVLVTDAWHMGRGKLAFEHYGLTPLIAPTDFPMGFFRQEPPLLEPKASLFALNIFGLSECFGQIQYRFMYLFKSLLA